MKTFQPNISNEDFSINPTFQMKTFQPNISNEDYST